jgi:hypothetical protein
MSLAGEAMMDIKQGLAAIAAAGLLAGTGSGAVAQDVEMLSGGSTAQWRMFSESDATTYLVDMASILRNGDEASVRIARVSKRLEAGDYHHVVDQFGVRCGAGETRVETSSDIAEDGVTADTYAADEPWTPAPRNSFDEAVKEMACGEKEPSRAPFETIRAWIDAGRP